MQCRLVAIEHKNLTGLIHCEDAAQLRPDRTAGAGDEDLLTLQIRRHGARIHSRRWASKNIGDANIPDVTDFCLAPDELIYGRHHFHHEASIPARLRQLLQELGRRARYGEQQDLRRHSLRNLGDRLPTAHHGDAHYTEEPLAFVVVEQRYWVIRRLLASQQSPYDLQATLTGTEDDRSLSCAIPGE